MIHSETFCKRREKKNRFEIEQVLKGEKKSQGGKRGRKARVDQGCALIGLQKKGRTAKKQRKKVLEPKARIWNGKNRGVPSPQPV